MNEQENSCYEQLQPTQRSYVTSSYLKLFSTNSSRGHVMTLSYLCTLYIYEWCTIAHSAIVSRSHEFLMLS